LGLGALQYAVYETALLPILNPNYISKDISSKLSNCFNMLSQRKIDTIFNEISSSVSENKVTIDRRKLDEIIMSEILNLAKEEQLEIYEAVIDLVKTRIERAKTVARRRKKKGVDVEALANGIITRLTTKIERFPDAYLSDYKGLCSKEIKIPIGQPILGSDINGFYVQVRGEEVYRGWNQEEVKFVYFAALTGSSSVRIPLDKQTITLAVKSFEEKYKRLKEEVDELLLTLITDAKIRKNVEEKIWKKIFQT
jgi:hypothetical protein